MGVFPTLRLWRTLHYSIRFGLRPLISYQLDEWFIIGLMMRCMKMICRTYSSICLTRLQHDKSQRCKSANACEVLLFLRSQLWDLTDLLISFRQRVSGLMAFFIRGCSPLGYPLANIAHWFAQLWRIQQVPVFLANCQSGCRFVLFNLGFMLPVRRPGPCFNFISHFFSLVFQNGYGQSVLHDSFFLLFVKTQNPLQL